MNMQRLIRFIEKTMAAVTFAEHGEHDHARYILNNSDNINLVQGLDKKAAETQSKEYEKIPA